MRKLIIAALLGVSTLLAEGFDYNDYLAKACNVDIPFQKKIYAQVKKIIEFCNEVDVMSAYNPQAIVSTCKRMMGVEKTYLDEVIPVINECKKAGYKVK